MIAHLKNIGNKLYTQNKSRFLALFCIVKMDTRQTDMGSFYNCIISLCSINQQSNYVPALISGYCNMIPNIAPDNRFVFVLCQASWLLFNWSLSFITFAALLLCLLTICVKTTASSCPLMSRKIVKPLGLYLSRLPVNFNIFQTAFLYQLSLLFCNKSYIMKNWKLK